MQKNDNNTIESNPQPAKMHFSNVSPKMIFMIALILIFIIGVVDTVTGYEFQVFVFYFIPIAFVAMKSSTIETYIVVALSGVSWLLSDRLSGYIYSNTYFEIWNTLIRMGAFFVIGHASLRITSLLKAERKLSNELQKALSEVKTLKGFIPICSSCKKIRNDQGNWQQLEEYISMHSDALFSHGYCKECAENLMKELNSDHAHH